MAIQHKEDVQFPGSLKSDVPGDAQEHTDEKPSSSPGIDDEKAEDGYENLNYPPAWKFEKYFVGGYSQKRMFKFKKPKSMYTAINLFAGDWTKPFR